MIPDRKEAAVGEQQLQYRGGGGYVEGGAEGDVVGERRFRTPVPYSFLPLRLTCQGTP